MPSLHRLRDAQRAAQALTDSELLEAADVENVSVDTGAVCYVLTFPRALYYSIISEPRLALPCAATGSSSHF